MSLLLLAAVAVHLPLLLMKLPLKSYDTNFHIFFASHYLHHWFNPWNPKWYAGFSQMTYPPMPQQWVAVLSHIFGLDLAYMAVELVAIMLLVVGVYRFAKLWVSPRAASFAALGSVFERADALGRDGQQHATAVLSVRLPDDESVARERVNERRGRRRRHPQVAGHRAHVERPRFAQVPQGLEVQVGRRPVAVDAELVLQEPPHLEHEREELVARAGAGR